MYEWKSLIKHDQHKIDYKGVQITVYDGVFTPDSQLTYSTTQTLEYLKALDLEDKKILDMGCGTGIIGIACLLEGAENVTFVDINPLAIDNTTYNLRENQLSDKAKVFVSNLFENIDDKFDIIFANLPISDDVWVPEIKQKPENIISKFLDQAPNYLNNHGKVIMNWGSFAGIEGVVKMVEALKYNYKLIKQNELGYEWYIIDISF